MRGEADAVGEHRDGEIVDVVGDAVSAAVEDRAAAGGAREVHSSARRGAERERR